jgi:alanine dehydrogenase
MDNASQVDPAARAFDRASSSSVRILGRREIVALMPLRDYVVAAEAAFRAYASGVAEVPDPMHIRCTNGGLHAKGAGVSLDGRDYVAVKANANFPGNGARALPTIQGAILLFDGEQGSLLAIMDSIEITARRTAATSVLAARFLAAADVRHIAILGCGEQGRAQLAAFADAMSPSRVLVYDTDARRADAFAREMREALRLDVVRVREVRDATRASEVIVTATSARAPFLSRDMVRAGAFVAAVGADNPDKSEIAPDLFASATIVVDSLAQCAVMGDLHHALAAGAVKLVDVHSELGELVVGRKAGRTREEEIVLFDSTGVGVLDAVAAVYVYRRACACDAGTSITLGTL